MSKTNVRVTIDSRVSDEQERAKLVELHRLILMHVMSLELRECVKVSMEFDRQQTAVSGDHGKEKARMWAKLSDRQQQIAGMLCDHYSIKRIADELYVSVNTVKKHIQNMKKALHIELSGADFIYALEQMMKSGAADGDTRTFPK